MLLTLGIQSGLMFQFYSKKYRDNAARVAERAKGLVERYRMGPAFFRFHSIIHPHRSCHMKSIMEKNMQKLQRAT